jgi:uncharacterized membrane protein
MDMLPFVGLCVAPLLAYLLWTRGASQQWGRWMHVGLGVAFAGFALGHFVLTDEMVDMLPAWVPAPLAVVYVTGVIELNIAVALMSERWRRIGSIAAATLLIGFFPVNVYAAWRHQGGESERQQGLSYLWVRAPVQLFFIAWAVVPLIRSNPSRTPRHS